jgi:hypothetical protein
MENQAKRPYREGSLLGRLVAFGIALGGAGQDLFGDQT